MGTTLLLVAQTVQHRARLFTENSKQEQARIYAENGLALTQMSPLLLATDPLYHRQDDNGNSWEIRTASENRKINILYALRGGETQRVVRQLANLGVDTHLADIFVSSLADWIDSDDLARLNGAEKDWYQAENRLLPKNAPIETIEELQLIRGFAEISEIIPDWQNLFTVQSNGKIDVNSASPRVLKAVFGFDDRNAEMLYLRSLGQDGIRYSTDDRPYQDISEFTITAGLRRPNNDSLYGRFLTTKPEILYVEITAIVEQTKVVLSALLDLRTHPAKVLHRKWLSPNERLLIEQN